MAARLADRATWAQWAGTSPDGNAITIWIAAGSGAAWEWARTEAEKRLLLVAPADRDPGMLDWTLLAPHAPAIVIPFDFTPATFLDRLAAAILRDGSRYILVLLESGLIRYERRAAA